MKHQCNCLYLATFHREEAECYLSGALLYENAGDHDIAEHWLQDAITEERLAVALESHHAKTSTH